MEPSLKSAKSLIESTFQVTVEQSADNVPQAERAIGTVKMVCRKVTADLPFPVHGTLTVFLVAWAVSRINLWPSANFFGKLCPREALTGVKACANTEVNAAFGDFLVADSTNAAFPNDLSSRAVDAMALLPTGNAKGDWRVLNLETMRYMTRVIRKGDIKPTPQYYIDRLKALAAKYKNAATLTFTTHRGSLQDIDPEFVEGMILPPVRAPLEDRSVDVDNDNFDADADDFLQAEDDPPVEDLQPPQPFIQPASNPLPDASPQAVYNPEIDIPDAIASANFDAADAEDDEVPPDDAPDDREDVVEYPDPEPEPPPIRRSARLNGSLAESISEPAVRKSPRHTDSLKSTYKSHVVTNDAGKRHVFHISLQKGLKLFGSKGTEAMRLEMDSLLKTNTIKGVVWDDLSKVQRLKSIRSMLFFKEKFLPDGTFDKLKARLVAGGHQQDRSVYTQDQTSSPTVATEVVMMVAAIAAKERRHILTCDIGSAFLKGTFNEDSTPIFMRLDKDVADVLCDLDKSFIKCRRHDGSLYVQLLRPLYGLIEAAKLWYDALTGLLRRLGFKVNAYDLCTWNKMHGAHQQTVIVHVDDLFVTCANQKANRWLAAKLTATFKALTAQEGLVHSYLGMTFDFTRQGKVLVTQEGYIFELLAAVGVMTTAKTPALDSP
jgi:hypothetical protein